MKTNSLLLLASLAVLTSTASAASNQTDPNVLALPTYVVTAPRYQPAEQQIKVRLEEFRQQALTPMAITPELNLLTSRAAPAVKLANTAGTPVAARIAKS
ncbi:MAG TPA: hypothetical protein VIM71_02925 [Lacunisphaera sp.]